MAVNMSLTDAKLYRGTAGSTPTTEVTTVKDVSFSVEIGEANISSRASLWELTEVTLLKAELTLTFNSDDSDTHLAALITACVTRAAIALKIVNKTSGQGLVADWKVTKMPTEQKLESEVSVSFTIKPTNYNGRMPSWG